MRAGNYSEEMARHQSVKDLDAAIIAALDATEQKALQFKDQFLKFSHLWTRQPSTSLQVLPLYTSHEHVLCLLLH